MDLTFEEKSAWGTLAALVIAGLWYFPKAFIVVRVSNNPIALIAISAIWVIILVIIEVIYHTVIAAAAPGDADKTDERDRLINLKAERNASFVLGIGLLWLVAWIVTQSVIPANPVPQPLEIVVLILFALTLSEIAKLTSQIWHYRLGS